MSQGGKRSAVDGFRHWWAVVPDREKPGLRMVFRIFVAICCLALVAWAVGQI